MEPEEENLYVNLEDLDGSKQQRPERPESEPGGKPEETASEGGTRTRTRTGSCFKVATLFLGLLSFLLLTSVVAVGFLYQRDFSQLSRELANQTAERSQLLLMQHNLTNQRDQLDARLKAAELDLDRTRSGSGEGSVQTDQRLDSGLSRNVLPCRMEAVRLQLLPSVFVAERLGKQQSSVFTDRIRSGDHQQPGGNGVPGSARSPAEVLDRVEGSEPRIRMEVDRWKFSRSHVLDPADILAPAHQNPELCSF
ncbi:uncharacterized protein LOC114144304 isoform X3 [Xiphophorus couchianus]|uniref:uncharacterized protein LOC114144304 isoform X3 n=1 Tax=Xiphophorus couchianus TaxID=32473 RepID=UPI001016B2C7|nr:uncharacterized protein LOC114144304 isoform X3 [Xiphophorus couchianus]